MSTEKKECPHCGGKFHIRGYANHVRTCPEQNSGGGGIDNAFETIWGPTWKVIKFMVAILLCYVLLHVINFLVGAGLDKAHDLYTYGYKFHLVAKLNANADLREEKEE